jgi:transcriptional regulator with XRE-family HTH domain
VVIESGARRVILRPVSDAREARSERRSIGALLQWWRRARGLSQLALAAQANVSPRHVSFLETGRAHPSREMVLRLGRVLDVPLREQNSLLLAAGFAPVYPESRLDAPALAVVRRALDAILGQHEPYPAVVMNRGWDVVRTNAAAQRFFAFLLGPRAASAPTNVLAMMLDPSAVRPFVANWEAVASTLVARVRREALGGAPDDTARQLLADMARFPGVAELLARADPVEPLVPVVPVSFEKAAHRFDFFSTVTVLGTPQDVTAQEIRIECFFPAHPETERAARQVLGAPHPPAA